VRNELISGAAPAPSTAPQRFLSSWSFRIGLLLLVPLLLFVPWRQEFLYRSGDIVFPVRATRYRLPWQPPLDASLDGVRLAEHLVLLAALVAAGYQYERTRRRPGWTPPGATAAYTLDDWNAETAGQEAGAPPSPCPACGRVGFYGPREDPDGRRYRLCNFCGFSQSVGAGAVELRACVHDCGKVPVAAGAPLIAWVGPERYSFRCQGCGEEVQVVDARATVPAYDPTHPWWNVPQGLSRKAYVRFWLNNGAPGHVYL
jgi:hypothetical protein